MGSSVIISTSTLNTIISAGDQLRSSKWKIFLECLDNDKSFGLLFLFRNTRAPISSLKLTVIYIEFTYDVHSIDKSIN